MRGIVAKGIVLARTNYSEADRILTILTPDHGKISVIAKGVRKSKSKLAAGVELFSVSHITFIPPKKDVGTLISSRLDKHWGNIVGDIDRTTFAYEVLKQVNKLTEAAPGPEYFELTAQTLAAADNTKLNLDVARLWYALHLLHVSGHTPNLKTDTNQVALDETSDYTFDLEKMAFSAHKAGMFNAQHIKLFRVLLVQKTTDKLTHLQGLDGVLGSGLQLVQAMLRTQLHI